MTRLLLWAGIGLGALAVLAVFWLRARALWAFTVDDTFITLRYAQHLAEGRGLIWNTGEAPVEGYTSFSWALLLGLPHALGIDAETSAKLGSAAATVATFVLVGLTAAYFARGTRVERALVAVTSGALLVLAPSSAVHAVSGMDTALFTFLLTAVLVSATAAARRPSRALFFTFAGAGLLAGITRPEGNLVFGVTALMLLWRMPRAARREALAIFVVVNALPIGLYFTWRFHTYGLLFPLPVYAKAVTTNVFWAGLGEARQFLSDVSIHNPVFGALVLAGGAALWRHGLGPALAGASSLYVASFKPAPLMAYEHRYLYPLLPWLCVLAGVGLGFASDRLLRHVTRRQRTHDPSARVHGLACMAACAAALGAGWSLERSHFDASVREFTAYGVGLRRAHVALGRRLRELQDGKSTPAIALLDAGAVAYYSGWTVIDTFGLNDRHIALHGRGDEKYVLSRNPQLLVVISKTAHEYVPVFAYERRLFERSITLGYRVAQSYAFAPDYHLIVLARRDFEFNRAELEATRARRPSAKSDARTLASTTSQPERD